MVKELREKARVQQINNVSFLGYMKHEELFQEIRKSLSAVLPSKGYENNPMSIIEAFALGTPVIGSRIGGIQELIKDYERGMTFDPGNPEDLASKIEFFLYNPDKAKEMGKNAKIFIKQELSPERYYHGLMKIYKEVMMN
jgi:glycosyltransferase involved in cell wall biosynthesis